MANSISFAANDLQTSTIITSIIDHESWPERKAAIYEIAHANKSHIPYTTFPQKPILIRGTIVAASVSALDTALDTFRGYFNGKDQNLDIGYGGGTRRYICTAKSVDIRRPDGLNHALFTVELIATDPFGRDTTTTSAKSIDTITTTPYSSTFDLSGSAPLQWPIITIDIDAVSGATDKTITFSNDDNGQAATTQARTWAVSDVLVIDCREKTMTVNGTEIDYTGAIPDFDTGTGINFTISHTLTTIDYDYDIDYYKRYL